MSNYTFKKTDGGPISKASAETWINNYKQQHKEGPWAFFLGTDIIKKVIDHPEAVGMRVYLGYDDNSKLQPILVGARADGSDIWPTEQDTEATAADQSYPCPPYCP